MPPATALVRLELCLPVVFVREGDWIVASFPTLDVASQGRTEDEAARNLIEATQAFIESCFERNVLDEVLKSCGFHAGPPSAGGPCGGRDHLTVPVELLAARKDSAAHAC